MRCQRCNQETTTYIMSMFNTQDICLDCKDKETRRINYGLAVKAEMDALKRGERSFPGIGLDE